MITPIVDCLGLVVHCCGYSARRQKVSDIHDGIRDTCCTSSEGLRDGELGLMGHDMFNCNT